MSKKVALYGLHAVQTIIGRNPERIVEVFVARERQDKVLMELVQNLQRLGVRPQFVPKASLDKRAEGGNHQGIIMIVNDIPQQHEDDLYKLLDNATKPLLLLILDGVTDPHNLGACLRTADAAGVAAVIVPKDKSASLNPTVRKVACGAAETVPLVQVTNLARTMREMQQRQVWIVGTAGEAEQSLYDFKVDGHLALVMGAEGSGMRRLTRETCDELVKIPMAGSVSSLNVSVATGVCLFEVVRQRYQSVQNKG